MNDAKYVGLDVHQATISAAVLDSEESFLQAYLVAERCILPDDASPRS